MDKKERDIITGALHSLKSHGSGKAFIVSVTTGINVFKIICDSTNLDMGILVIPHNSEQEIKTFIWDEILKALGYETT